MKRAVLGNSNVKILGSAGYESREEMIKQMDYIENYTMKKKGIWKRTFSKLKVGNFIMQYGIANPRKLKVPTFLLDDKHSMPIAKRETILEKLKATKYALPFYLKKETSMRERIEERSGEQ